MIFHCITFSLSTVDWTAVSAIVTTLMMVATFWTVYQNKKQLTELKRQWKEEHSPNVVCELSPSQDTPFLRLHVINPSNVVAENVTISIDDNLDYSNYPKDSDLPPIRTQYISEITDFLSSQKFTLPPKGSIYFNVDIPIYGQVTIDGYIVVTIEIGCTSKRKYKLYPSNFKYYSELDY